MNYSCSSYDYETGQIIGSFYIILFIIGLSGNTICGLSLLRSKLWFVPTYFFIINQCLADVLCLICIGFYTGFELCTVSCPSMFGSGKHRTDKFMTFLLQMGWYPSGYFAVFLALSRLIALKSNITYTQRFKKKHLLSAAYAVWLAVFGLALTSLLQPGHPMGAVVHSIYTFGMITISPLSKIIEYYNFIHDSFVSLAVLLINCLSVIHVIRTHGHVRISENIENKRLEVKLFVQCLCTTTFLMVICSIYASIFFMGWTTQIDDRLFVVFHVSWILYHTCCPLVYLFTNEKLRFLMSTNFLCFHCD